MKRFFTLLLVLINSFGACEYSCAQDWEWGKGNTGAFVDGWPIATDPQGNVIVAAMTEGLAYTPTDFGSFKIPFSVGLLGNQCIVAKYDSAGNFLWATGTENGDTHLMGLATDKNGNSFLFGTMNSNNLQIGSIVLTNSISPAIQYFIAKFDPSGNVVWAKTEGSAPGGPGPAGTVFGTGHITTDDEGNLYVATSFKLPAAAVGSHILANSCPACNTSDILLAKYSNAGNLLWATSAGGSGDDEAYGVTVTPSGDIYISGIFSSPSVTFGQSTLINPTGGWNGYIARFNASGAAVWAAGSGGSGYEMADFASTVTADATNNVYLTGWVWDTTISYAGTTIINPYPNNLVAYLVKFNSSNEVSWYKTMGCPKGGNSMGYGIAISPCAVWLCGSFNNDMVIDGNVLDTPASSADPAFIAGFNFEGTYIGSAALQSGGDDQNGIACDKAGNVYLCADYEKINAFTVGSKTLAHVEKNLEHLYVAKYVPLDLLPQDAAHMHEEMAVCLSKDKIDAPPGHTNYLWNDGSTAASMPVHTEGTYEVTSMGGCTLIDTIAVTNNKELCGCPAMIPTAFTPNGDGKDDAFGPLFERGCSVSNYSILIFNRWGQKVFASHDPSSKWTGDFWHITAELGVYTYYMQYTSGTNNTVYTFNGDVTLVK